MSSVATIRMLGNKLIGRAANLALQGGVKSADGEADRFGASSVVFAAVRCIAG